MNDVEMSNTIARTSTLPEEMGRIRYLLSDKTAPWLKTVFFFLPLILCDDGLQESLWRWKWRIYIWEQCRMALTQWMKSLINWLLRLGPQEITVSKGLFEAYFFHVVICRASEASLAGNGAQLATRGRRDMSSQVRDVVLSQSQPGIMSQCKSLDLG